jgi:hypothetical protein
MNLKIMNNALLCKWLWRYYNNKIKGLWNDIIKSRYHNRRTLVNASTFWKEVNKEIIIFNTSINKIVGNSQTIKFWIDRWITKVSLKDYYPLLYEIEIIKDIIVDRIIGYNRFYLNFNRPLNVALAQQLESLYIQLTVITLNTELYSIRWRWSSNGLFSVRSCYN